MYAKQLVKPPPGSMLVIHPVSSSSTKYTHMRDTTPSVVIAGRPQSGVSPLSAGKGEAKTTLPQHFRQDDDIMDDDIMSAITEGFNHNQN
jgi:hypothetical protein